MFQSCGYAISAPILHLLQAKGSTRLMDIAGFSAIKAVPESRR
jgi:hypothetical protein